GGILSRRTHAADAAGGGDGRAGAIACSGERHTAGGSRGGKGVASSRRGGAGRRAGRQLQFAGHGPGRGRVHATERRRSRRTLPGTGSGPVRVLQADLDVVGGGTKLSPATLKQEDYGAR